MEDVVKSHNVFVFQFFQEAYFSQSRAWHSLNKNASIFNFRSTKKLHRLYFYYLIVIIQTNSFECYNFLRLFIFSLEYCPISTCKKTFHFQKTTSFFTIYNLILYLRQFFPIFRIFASWQNIWTLIFCSCCLLVTDIFKFYSIEYYLECILFSLIAARQEGLANVRRQLLRW